MESAPSVQPSTPPQAWFPPVPPADVRRFPLSPAGVTSLLGLIIGALIFTGLVSFHAVFLIPPPGSGSIPPSTSREVIDYINTVRMLGWISIVAMDLAIGLTVMIAFIVGGMRGEMSDGMRRGVFIFATVFLALWLLLSSFLYSSFRSLIPFR